MTLHEGIHSLLTLLICNVLWRMGFTNHVFQLLSYLPYKYNSVVATATSNHRIQLTRIGWSIIIFECVAYHPPSNQCISLLMFDYLCNWRAKYASIKGYFAVCPQNYTRLKFKAGLTAIQWKNCPKSASIKYL